jgi:peroxiredoxin
MTIAFRAYRVNIVALALAAWIGGFGSTRAQQAGVPGGGEPHPNGGARALDVAVQPTERLEGIVLLPDGKPAVEVEVLVATAEDSIVVRAGDVYTLKRDVRFAITKADGRFSFRPPNSEYVLVAACDAGFADSSPQEFAKSHTLALKAWGQIDGGVRIGARQAPGQEVRLRPIRPREKRWPLIQFGDDSTRTDERGRFHFDHVISGPGEVSRAVITKIGNQSIHAFGWQQSLLIRPGETLQVKIGGTGRPVIGRFKIEGTLEAPIDWTQNGPVVITRQFISKITSDGAFRVEDVVAGRHVLQVNVTAPTEGPGSGRGRVLGTLTKPVTIPEMLGGRSNEPLDLGTLTVKLFDALKVGDIEPDFDVERIGVAEKGRRVKLSDYRGKLVLLSFWPVWQIGYDMHVLEEVQREFGADPRFAIIGVACGPSAAVSHKALDRNWLAWTHGFDGDLYSGVASLYKIRQFMHELTNSPKNGVSRVPMTFLIGPAGRIVGHDLMGKDLEAVRKALDDPKLFPTAAKTGAAK